MHVLINSTVSDSLSAICTTLIPVPKHTSLVSSRPSSHFLLSFSVVASFWVLIFCDFSTLSLAQVRWLKIPNGSPLVVKASDVCSSIPLVFFEEFYDHNL